MDMDMDKDMNQNMNKGRDMDTGMGMVGAITAVAAITMVGTAATTMAGGIIAIGDDFHL